MITISFQNCDFTWNFKVPFTTKMSSPKVSFYEFDVPLLYFFFYKYVFELNRLLTAQHLLCLDTLKFVLLIFFFFFLKIPFSVFLLIRHDTYEWHSNEVQSTFFISFIVVFDCHFYRLQNVLKKERPNGRLLRTKKFFWIYRSLYGTFSVNAVLTNCKSI